jgi:gamma-glutamyltranspeptidase / glutathione hydrolase
MTPENAFTAPRFSTAHHTSSFGQSKPKCGSLSVNSRIGESVQADLKSRGHVLTVSEGNVGGVALIGIEAGSKFSSRDRKRSEHRAIGDARSRGPIS